jgi:hypothetical protein
VTSLSICSVPGGKYVSSGTIFAPTSVGQYYTTATPAVPTQSGSIDDCGNYYDVVAGDTVSEEEHEISEVLADLSSVTK